MIREKYVSPDTARLLKEKGFDEVCTQVYKDNGCLWDNAKIDGKWLTQEQLFSSECLAPTLQMTLDWLLTEHRLFVEIEICKPYGAGKDRHAVPIDGVVYYPKIVWVDEWNHDLQEFKHQGLRTYETPEKACAGAIDYCVYSII